MLLLQRLGLESRHTLHRAARLAVHRQPSGAIAPRRIDHNTSIAGFADLGLRTPPKNQASPAAFRVVPRPVFNRRSCNDIASPHGHPEKPKEYTSRPRAPAHRFPVRHAPPPGGRVKIAVIGAGMAGVAAAQALAAAGHEVTVVERRSSVAEESSFAPAGIAAPG
ncbi:MAG: FAD-dependent oxidoreductase, partial [Burkholderiaceae bacterium]